MYLRPPFSLSPAGARCAVVHVWLRWRRRRRLFAVGENFLFSSLAWQLGRQKSAFLAPTQFRSARLRSFRQSSRWKQGWRRNQQCGCSSLCSDSDEVCHFQRKCTDIKKEERVWGRDVRADLRLVDRFFLCAIHTSRWQRLKDSGDALVGTSWIPVLGIRRRLSGSLHVGSVPLSQEVHFWTRYILLSI